MIYDHTSQIILLLGVTDTGKNIIFASLGLFPGYKNRNITSYLNLQDK